MITLTDAPGDFLNYMVDVVSLKLTRADGTVVETVPTTTEVDFAQLVNLSAVLSAESIPTGRYVAASLTLNYTGASLIVNNGASGLSVAAGNIIDGATATPLVAPNNEITVSLSLPAGNPLVITAGAVANLALDFNLAASNTVTPAGITSSTAAASVTVTVNPVLTASLVPDTSKQIQVRGALASVTNTASATSYTVNLRPFFNGPGATSGQFVVATTATTTFNVNGTAFAGSAGLIALSALPTGTITSATGSFDVTTGSFTAATVTAGSSSLGSTLDSVEGTVTARNGDTLTIGSGLFIPHYLGGASVARQVTVTVAATTSVSETGESGMFGLQDISVGQHAQFFGTAATGAGGATSTGGTATATLDASAGSVTLTATPLVGQVLSSTTGSVTLSLQSLDGESASVFNFAGTGASTANDASAASYVASVPAGLISVPITAGSTIRLSGFVTPFGTAPPDFAGISLVSYANTNAQLHVQWNRPGVSMPFVPPLSAANVQIAQSTLKSAARDNLTVGSQQLDPASIAAGLSLIPNSAATNPEFAISHSSSDQINTYSSFTDLITALTTDLNGTAALLQIAASGPYDATTGVLSVNQVAFVLSD
jgi:hypothetical protein